MRRWMGTGIALVALSAAVACSAGKPAAKASNPHGTNGEEGGHLAQRTTEPPDPATSICGEVRIAPELAPRVTESAVLFVFSKPQLGGGPPAAVVRRETVSFPSKFCLSQKNTMAGPAGPSFNGSQYVTARVEFDHTVGGVPGDLETVTKQPVAVGTSDLVLTIDTVRQ